MDYLSTPTPLACFTIVSTLSLAFARFGSSLNARRIVSSDDLKSFNSKGVNNDDKSDDYDVVIVGAGPAGSTAAYFLGRQGKKVALLDKKHFPRAKPCGDAWCAPALTILEEMGVLKKMEEDGIIKSVTRGGFISPFGYRCINTDGAAYGSVTGCRTYAIKRHIADEYLVKAAAALPSVKLLEGVDIGEAEFDRVTKRWRLTRRQTETNSASDSVAVSSSCRSLSSTESEFVGRVLLVCDGSTSYLGQKIGIVPKGSQPEAQCSHAYVAGDSHNWTEADGVMIFSKSVLPGYSALFRHYNNDMYLGTYILPGGRATSRAIDPFEREAIERHPYIHDAFGGHYSYAEKRVVAPIRMGGLAKSYGEQCLLVGDSAGHVDPLTGEGIHTAMIAAKIAAECVGEMCQTGNFSSQACRAYHLRCYDAFVGEFFYSSLAARIIYACPILLDAVAVVGQRRGQAFLDFFGECMTGVRPKSDFARPDLAIEIILETVRQIFLQYLVGMKSEVPQDIGKEAVEKYYSASLKR